MLSLSLNNFWGANIQRPDSYICWHEPGHEFWSNLLRKWQKVLFWCTYLIWSGVKIWKYGLSGQNGRKVSLPGDNRWSKRKSERFPSEQPPIRGEPSTFFATFRSLHFFQLHFSPSFFWKFYTPRCMNQISHLAPMSFLETVKWLWPECQIDHPANCGIWALSHFIFAITQYQEFLWYFLFFFMIPPFSYL